MNKLILLLLFLLSSLLINEKLHAQLAPTGIVFQAVAKDLNYNAASNRNVYCIVNILENTFNGPIAYSESFITKSTNEGMFSIIIGQGDRISGINTLSNLNWSSKTYFFNIKIAIQPTLFDPSWSPENNYVDLGTTQFWSVPYSFVSLNSKFSDSASTLTNILTSNKGGTGVDNNGKFLKISNNLITKGIGDLIITTTGESNITLPRNGIIANTQYVDDKLSQDSTVLSNKINTKLDSSQFPLLIEPYLRSISGMKYSDTAAMLNNYTKRFTQNFNVKIASGKTLGKYKNGDIINASGKTLDEFMNDVLTETIPPIYIPPTISINSTPQSNIYEIGSSLSLNFTSNYIQNDGGTLINSIYKKSIDGGITFQNLNGNTDNVTLLIPLNFQVQAFYNGGLVKNNNIGSPDPTGKIIAGSINSTSITFTPKSKCYWGVSESNSINQLTLLQNNSQFCSSKNIEEFNISISSGSKYIYYAYPASFGRLSSITIGGFESISAFTEIQQTVINAQGYSQPYYIYISNNNFTEPVNKIIVN